jgi:multidrug resistance efflux pump
MKTIALIVLAALWIGTGILWTLDRRALSAQILQAQASLDKTSAENRELNVETRKNASAIATLEAKYDQACADFAALQQKYNGQVPKLTIAQTGFENVQRLAGNLTRVNDAQKAEIVCLNKERLKAYEDYIHLWSYTQQLRSRLNYQEDKNDRLQDQIAAANLQTIQILQSQSSAPKKITGQIQNSNTGQVEYINIEEK